MARNVGTFVLLAAVSFGASGCMTARLLNENRSPSEYVLLPVTIGMDLIGYSLLTGAGFESGPGRGLPAMGPQPSSASMGFPDPGPWVGECRGPVLCPEGEHHVCNGYPGNCDCLCEVTTPVETPACIPATPIEPGGFACKPPGKAPKVATEVKPPKVDLIAAADGR